MFEKDIKFFEGYADFVRSPITIATMRLMHDRAHFDAVRMFKGTGLDEVIQQEHEQNGFHPKIDRWSSQMRMETSVYIDADSYGRAGGEGYLPHIKMNRQAIIDRLVEQPGAYLNLRTPYGGHWNDAKRIHVVFPIEHTHTWPSDTRTRLVRCTVTVVAQISDEDEFLLREIGCVRTHVSQAVTTETISCEL